MGEAKPGWYYVGTGKLRYDDGDGWTDHYKPVDDAGKPDAEPLRSPRDALGPDCVPASGVTPLRVMLCVVHCAVRAWVVSITSGWAGRVGRAVGSGAVSRAMEVSER